MSRVFYTDFERVSRDFNLIKMILSLDITAGQWRDCSSTTNILSYLFFFLFFLIFLFCFNSFPLLFVS